MGIKCESSSSATYRDRDSGADPAEWDINENEVPPTAESADDDNDRPEPDTPESHKSHLATRRIGHGAIFRGF